MEEAESEWIALVSKPGRKRTRVEAKIVFVSRPVLGSGKGVTEVGQPGE